jgi:hypothetical protein
LADVLPNIDISNWISREIAISPEADNAIQELFQGSSARAASQSKVDLQQDKGNYLAIYGVDSTRSEIQLTGSAVLKDGEARVFFDQSFTAIISENIPIRVLTTPTSTGARALYVAEKTVYGFVVKDETGVGEGTFDWLVVARRKGFDEDATPVATPESTPAVSGTDGGSTPTPETIGTPEPTPNIAVDSTPTPTPDISSVPESTPEPSPEPAQESTPEPESQVAPDEPDTAPSESASAQEPPTDIPSQ